MRSTRPAALHLDFLPSLGTAAAWWPVFAAFGAHVLILFLLLRSFDFNPTGPIHLADTWHDPQFQREADIVLPGMGYDGQFFYYLAHDPLLRQADPHRFLDYPAYRYGRILYPALAWVVGLGRPEALPWALLAVNLVAASVGTAAAVDILRQIGARPQLALAFAFSPAVLVGLADDLAEPTSFALVALGFACYLRAHYWRAATLLALATLARETSLLVPLGFALHAAVRRDWRRAATLLLSLAIPLAWHAWVWARLGAPALLQAPPNFGLPLSGPIYRAGVLLGLDLGPLRDMLPDHPLPELLVVAASVVIICRGLVAIVGRRDIFAIQFWLQALAALFTGPVVWNGLDSYARVLTLLYLLYAMVLCTGRIATRGPSAGRVGPQPGSGGAWTVRAGASALQPSRPDCRTPGPAGAG